MFDNMFNKEWFLDIEVTVLEDLMLDDNATERSISFSLTKINNLHIDVDLISIKLQRRINIINRLLAITYYT